MKKVIDGKVYNTDTADVVCDLSSMENYSSSQWHETLLYRTRNGTFFLAGEGGAASMWAGHVGHTPTGGAGLRVIDVEEARRWMESAECDQEEFEKFGLSVVEG